MEFTLRYMGRGNGWQCRSKHGDPAIVGWGSRPELALRDYKRQAKCFPGRREPRIAPQHANKDVA